MLEVLADELERMSDPRLELVTFTGVKVTRDLGYATVYYSTLGATTAGAPESFADDAAAALSHAAPHLRVARRPPDADPPGAAASRSRSTPASSPGSASTRSCAASTTNAANRIRLVIRPARRTTAESGEMEDW